MASHRLAALLFLPLALLAAEGPTDRLLPVRGLCIAAPRPRQVDAFIEFIRTGLAPRGINTLILRVDYGFQFKSRPELADPAGLSAADAARLAAACRTNGIRVIPQINLLGHQSWELSTGKLLQVYPDFDETPWVKYPEKYAWPNPDGLYCRSYCTLHPDVHAVVFALMDEVCDAFGADAFHAGMDEVFYLGEARCPRCGGRDRSVLFAHEVQRIHDRLKAANRELWMWGDRLLDGRTTGLGEWEASFNDTHRAVDLIPKDVVICDWHYERADLSAVYFAMKGFRVVTCPWRNAGHAVTQFHDMVRFRQQSPKAMAARFQGIVQTVWSDAGGFLRDFEAQCADPERKRGELDAARCFLAWLEALKNLPAAGSAGAP